MYSIVRRGHYYSQVVMEVRFTQLSHLQMSNDLWTNEGDVFT